MKNEQDPEPPAIPPLPPATGSARDWSKDFNALPDEVRLIGCAMEARTRIQMLEMEKDRLKKSYRRNIGEIDAYIESCRVWLHKLEVPNVCMSEGADKR